MASQIQRLLRVLFSLVPVPAKTGRRIPAAKYSCVFTLQIHSTSCCLRLQVFFYHFTDFPSHFVKFCNIEVPKRCTVPALSHILRCKYICNRNIWDKRSTKGAFGTRNKIVEKFGALPICNGSQSLHILFPRRCMRCCRQSRFLLRCTYSPR